MPITHTRATNCPLTGKIFPVLDEALVMEASRLATGAHVHEANTLIGLYRNALANIERFVAVVAETGKRPDDVAEMTRRMEFADKSERNLRTFVAQRRQEAV